MNKLCTQTNKNTLFLSRWGDEAVAEITCHDKGVFFKETEQGIDFDIVLERKPRTNVFSYQVRSKNLAWYFQPALTRAEIRQGCYRPETAVGSYAVYHQSKRNGIYETGKAFHISRPVVVDRNGERSWAKLRYRDGQLDVVVDPAFLRRAAYPVIVDPTFGYTTAGASSYASGPNYMLICPLQALSEAGTLTGMSVYGRYLNSGDNIQLAVYDSDGDLVANTGAIGLVYPNGWVSGDLTSNPSAAAGDYYLAYEVSATNSRVSYDSAASAAFYKSNSYGTWPASIASKISSNSWVFSMYVTYTASGGTTYTLTVADLANSHALDSPSLIPTFGMSPADLAHGHSLDSPSLVPTLKMSPADLTHGHTLDSPALVPTFKLTLADMLHGHTLDSPSLVRTHSLAVGELSHAHGLDAVGLKVIHAIVVDALAHAQSLDSPTLALTHLLSVADMLHGHGIENVAVAIGSIGLSVDNLHHSHILDSPVLVITHELTVDDLLSSHLLDSISLSNAMIYVRIGGVWVACKGDSTSVAAEPPLGSPTVDGSLLSSTVAGVRSWALRNSIALTPVVSLFIDYADAVSYLNSGEPGREYHFVVPVGATGAWAGKDNQIAIYKSSVWRYETPVDYQQVIAYMDAGYSQDGHIYQYIEFAEVWVQMELKVHESSLTLEDNTTGDVSASAHGLCPKLPAVATKVLYGDGSWMEVAGSTGVIKVYSKPSANVRNTNAAAVATHSLTDVLLKEWVLGESVKGVRISFLVKSSTSGYVAQAQIRRNGTAIGTLRESTTVAGNTYTEDFTDLWSSGDVIQLYGSIDDVSKTCTVSAFNFLYDRAIAGFGPWNIDTPTDFLTTAEQTAYSMTANS